MAPSVHNRAERTRGTLVHDRLGSQAGATDAAGRNDEKLERAASTETDKR